MKKLIQVLSLVLMVAGSSASVYAKKNTYDLSKYPTKGINGMEYVLQKPLGNPSYPDDERGFFKHIYIGGGFGISMKGDNYMQVLKPGYNLNIQAGSWFTPVHGIRLEGLCGVLPVQQGYSRACFVSGHVDYTLHLTNLLRGYNPNRKFELIGTVGPEFQMIRMPYSILKSKAWYKSVGLGASFQARVNLNPAMFMYVEPRLSVLTRTKYNFDSEYGFYRIRTYATLNLGLGYRILHGKYRQEGTMPFQQINDDNLYFGLGAGVWTFPRNSYMLKNFALETYAGKMFSSTSGIQWNIAYGLENKDKFGNQGYYALTTLDYVLNLDNAFGGYRPNQFFNVMMNVGFGGAIARRKEHHSISPAFSAGLTGLFRLSDNWSLTLHPQLYIFNREFNKRLEKKYSPLTSLELGVRYTTGNFSRLRPESYDIYNSEEVKKWFVTAGAGYGYRVRGGIGSGGDLFVGFGKRFTPISSWRLSVNADAFPRFPYSLDATMQFDYMSSMTTAMCGYNPDRLFDFQFLVGIYGGMANNQGPLSYSYGVRTGFQASFRINDFLDIYLEPTVQATDVPYESYLSSKRLWTPEFRGNIGLRYRLGTPSEGRGHISGTPYGDHRFFAGVSAGSAIYFGGTMRHATNKAVEGDVSGVLDVNVGYWFSRVCGARVVYSNDWAPYRHSGSKTYLGSAHLDYLLNLTSWFDGDPERRFHIIGAVGAGVGICPTGRKTTGLMTYGGIQFRYNLPWYNLDVHIEPGANFWAGRLMPVGLKYNNRVSAAARFTAGVSYRF